MLVLRRKVLERCILTLPSGEQIIVAVVEIRNDSKSVRLGFDAPSSVRVDREEVHNKLAILAALKAGAEPVEGIEIKTTPSLRVK